MGGADVMFTCVQSGTVNYLLIGRHLLPDIQLGIGKNAVFIGDVLPPGIVFNEAAAVVHHIAAGGVVSVLVDPHIPAIAGIVDVVDQMLGDLQGFKVLDIHPAQFLVIPYPAVKLKTVEVLGQID